MAEDMTEKFRQMAGIPHGCPTSPHRIGWKLLESSPRGGWRGQKLYWWKGEFYLQPVLRMLGDQDPPCQKVTVAEAAEWMAT